jgi:hypothetical protein
MNLYISTIAAVCVLAATVQVATAASAHEAVRADPARHVYEWWGDYPVQAAATIERDSSARDSTADPDAEYRDRAGAADAEHAEHKRELYEAVLGARISD